MRSLRAILAGAVLATLLALDALVLLGPKGLGSPGPGYSRAGVVAPTLLRLIAFATPRRAPPPEAPPAAAPPTAPGVVRSPATAQAPPAAAQPAAAQPAAATSAGAGPEPARAAAGADRARTYVVRAGDTLWEIAHQYGVAVQDLASANKGVDPGDLRVGQVLTIPPGSVAAPAAPEPVPSSLAHAFDWPVLAPISSLFGPRWGGFHTGIDLAVPSGTAVHAARDGKVELAGPLGGYGLCIILDHPDGTRTLYAHNSRLLVGPGDTVRQGDVIARSGNTGNSTGPHLHFELIVAGKPRNPLDYLPDKGLAIEEYR